MVEQVSTLLGTNIPLQFAPVLTLISGMMLIFLIAFFCEVIKLIILRR